MEHDLLMLYPWMIEKLRNGRGGRWMVNVFAALPVLDLGSFTANALHKIEPG